MRRQGWMSKVWIGLLLLLFATWGGLQLESRLAKLMPAPDLQEVASGSQKGPPSTSSPAVSPTDARAGATLAAVHGRMRYWTRWAPLGLPTGTPQGKLARRYLLFDPDAGGLNNIRLSWEVAGIIALQTNRTLVLPPPRPFYLIDVGPSYFRPPVKGSTSRVEDFVSLRHLRRGLDVLTFEEFTSTEAAALQLPEDVVSERRAGGPMQWARRWADFAATRFATIHGNSDRICDLNTWRTDDLVLYARMVTHDDGRLFGCTKWWENGQLNLMDGGKAWQAPPAAVALLRGCFVWHEEVFELAAPIVADLGLFEYAALHARYGDFQFTDSRESASGIITKWFASELGRRVMDHVKTVYISTDATSAEVIDAFRKRGYTAKWSKDYFDSATSPIAGLLRRLGPARVNQLKGPTEQVVAVFARVFVGTDRSTFSGYINEMRFSADAPQTRPLRTVQGPTQEVFEAVQAAIAKWTLRGGMASWRPVPSD